jgi:ParB family chromosome partitioning protein
MTKSGIKNKMLGISAAILADTKAANQGDGIAPKVGEDGLPAPRAPRTAPGHMFAHVGQIRERDATIKDLEQRLDKFGDSVPTKKIDPHLIKATKWANRHEKSFASDEFKELVKEIGAAGGNVQPIKVRPVPGSEPLRYEIVFGHRRHQACLELGLQVLAMIEPIDDQRLFVEMDRENRERADLRPYEQGVMYARALDEGLFPSLRKMAEALGVDASNASKAITLARLPDAVIEVFESPLELLIRWAPMFTDALQNRPDALLAKAKELAAMTEKPRALEAFKALISAGVVPNHTPAAVRARVVKGIGRKSGKIHYDPKKGAFSVVLSGLGADKMDEIEGFLKKILG